MQILLIPLFVYPTDDSTIVANSIIPIYVYMHIYFTLTYLNIISDIFGILLLYFHIIVAPHTKMIRW